MFNHRYEKNITKLLKYYNDRFDNIKVIIPFYISETDERIITVYENSHNFQGFISQSYSRIQSDLYNYYVFIADDCLLNPSIDQMNILNKLKLKGETSFITNVSPLAPSSLTWSNFTKEKLGFYTPGVEYSKELPDISEALSLIKRHEILNKIPDKNFIEYKTLNSFFFFLINSFSAFIYFVTKKKIKISYKFFPKIQEKLPFPLLFGFSDFFIVNNESLREFSRYCGIFTSMRMFAEIAIPTALALSSPRLVDLQTTTFQVKAYWSNFRKTDLEKLRTETHGNVNELFLGNRQNILWFHPIKFSSWEIR
jgi:hypothetical protein